MPKLAGKIAWVTGAGSGIGEAAALALADEGATIVLTGRRHDPLEHVAGKIREKGGTAHVQRADLMQSSQVQKVGSFIKDTLGRLDILVNNAGLNIVDRHWSKLTPQGIDEVVHGNLSSALYCVTVALPMMRAQKDGREIAVHDLVDALRRELAPVPIDDIQPGIVHQNIQPAERVLDEAADLLHL